MAILIFVLVLLALVLVHELGHFFAAKKTGMRVDEFGFGFPPRLASFRRGETRYSINALPLGGFVKIYGEDGEEGEDREKGEGALCAPAPESGNDRSRSFVGKPKWAQALVLVAGIGANILFAWLLFTVALAHGVLTGVSPESATPAAQLYILEVIPESPAAVAGVPAGAVVASLSAHGETIIPRTPEEFSNFISASGGAPVAVEYAYQDKTEYAELTAVSGVFADAPEKVAVGVSLGLAEVQALPLHKAVAEGFVSTIRGLRDTVSGIFLLLASAVVFNANLADVAGPVGIVGLVGSATALGFSSLLMFTAFISLNLAVINILPFPALDGGRLLFVVIEAVKGSPIPAKVAYYANATGFAVLIILMLAITYNDIVKLV